MFVVGVDTLIFFGSNVKHAPNRMVLTGAKWESEMALKIQIDSADDILQFVKVLFVSSEIIQKQIKEQASIQTDNALKESATLELIHDVMVDIEKNVEKLHEVKKNPVPRKRTAKKQVAKNI